MTESKFSFTDAIIAIVLIGVMVGIIAPALKPARTITTVTKCWSNLKQIGTAIHTYSSDHNEKFPAAVGIITGDASSNTHALAMDSLAILYPNYINDGRLFICDQAKRAIPLEDDEIISGMLSDLFADYDTHAPAFIAEFSALHCDYGYDPTHAANHKPGVPIAADRPNTNVRDNSPNHALAGQNVLYIDGSVAWQSSTNCGYLNDEIYDVARPAGSTNDRDNSNIK